MFSTQVGDHPSYKAISYVWGSYEDKVEITVDGHAFFITKNLHDALEDLRDSVTIGVFWTDQLCINQANHQEKMSQVAVMGSIYHFATTVVVYLGPSTEQSETEIRDLRSFIEPHAPDEEAPWSHIGIHNLERSIASILARPWFERIWTVQEAVLARHMILQLGRDQVRWLCDLKTLRALIFRIKTAVISPVFALRYGPPSKLDWAPLLYILESQMRQAARRENVIVLRNLCDIAFDFRDRYSTDPRDRYFAIMGIYEHFEGDGVRQQLGHYMNYKMSADEVYRRFKFAVQSGSEIEDVPLE